MKKKIFAICTILIIMGAMVFNCFADTYDTFNDVGDDYNPFNYSAAPNSYDIIIDRSRIAEYVNLDEYRHDALVIFTKDSTKYYLIIIGDNLQNNVGIQNADTIVETSLDGETWSMDYAYLDYNSVGGNTPRFIRLSNVYQPVYYKGYYDNNGFWKIEEYPALELYYEILAMNNDIYDKIIQIWNREQYGLQERWWNENNTGEAYNAGYNNGYTTGLNTGYNQGYTAGLETADNGSFSQLVATTIQTPVNVLRSILNFEFLGVNLFAVFTSLLTIALFIAVIKTVI